MANSIFANYPDVVSVDDVQAMLHIGRNAAYSLLQSGAISTVRVGKRYIIPKASVIDFLGLNKGAKPAIMNPSGKACESLERSK
ncbi:helix-turn-helix domain-containing protein [Acutalibacter caecimuris]|uniref:helix-turn-helix domain-containing protein n=1 Tax=Acutalibacter caecimuris TaxID=3093657 RepID=UPI002AC8D549|nr:helix-turn-helix domain-containing protein [Acutalibacter sp. M00118]